MQHDARERAFLVAGERFSYQPWLYWVSRSPVVALAVPPVVALLKWDAVYLGLWLLSMVFVCVALMLGAEAGNPRCYRTWKDAHRAAMAREDELAVINELTKER